MTSLPRRSGYARSRLAASVESLFFRPAWDLARDLETFEWAPAADIAAAGWERAFALLAHAADTVPHYGRLLAEHGLSPRGMTPAIWTRLPILTKSALRQGFPHDITSRALPRPGRTYSTSGSTGLPLKVYRDPAALLLDRAVRRWHYGWCGLQAGDIIAYIKLMRTVAGPVYPLWAVLSGCRYYNTDGLYRGDHAGLARALNRWRPAAVYGSPMTLSDASRLLIEGRHTLNFTPKAMITGNLGLSRESERLISGTFGVPVHNRYGAAEFGTWIAQSCPDLVRGGATATENLHVNARRFLVEVVDDQGRPLPPGREGRLLITDLYNRVMPLIRYEIGDAGVLAAEPCRCGRGLPLLEKLCGRTNEVLILPSGATYLGWRLYVALEPHTSSLRAYQFLQTALDRLTLAVVPDAPSFGPRDAAHLAEVIRKALPESVEVTVEVVKEIPPGPSGKRSVLKTLGERP